MVLLHTAVMAKEMQESGSLQTMQKQTMRTWVQPTATAVTGGFARLTIIIVTTHATSAMTAMPTTTIMSATRTTA